MCWESGVQLMWGPIMKIMKIMTTIMRIVAVVLRDTLPSCPISGERTPEIRMKVKRTRRVSAIIIGFSSCDRMRQLGNNVRG